MPPCLYPIPLFDYRVKERLDSAMPEGKPPRHRSRHHRNPKVSRAEDSPSVLDRLTYERPPPEYYPEPAAAATPPAPHPRPMKRAMGGQSQEPSESELIRSIKAQYRHQQACLEAQHDATRAQLAAKERQLQAAEARIDELCYTLEYMMEKATATIAWARAAEGPPPQY
jgi:hypothetical protein